MFFILQKKSYLRLQGPKTRITQTYPQTYQEMEEAKPNPQKLLLPKRVLQAFCVEPYNQVKVIIGKL